MPYNSDREKRLRARAIDKLGGKCVRCGFSDQRALQFDHINGGGHRRNRSENQMQRYRKIITGEYSDIQILCANCNSIKRAEMLELPWKAHNDYKFADARKVGLLGGHTKPSEVPS